MANTKRIRQIIGGLLTVLHNERDCTKRYESCTECKKKWKHFKHFYPCGCIGEMAERLLHELDNEGAA